MGWGDLSDEEWARLEPHVPTDHGRGGRRQCHRRVINGILSRQRTGLPWRDPPPCFGSWKTVHSLAQDSWSHPHAVRRTARHHLIKFSSCTAREGP
ncbi:transposase [Streptomyces sp. ND04-05B]|uniref:transposase n=1 Tax=Streptomyces TaxID=1883 RepID=UPI0039F5BA65